jgi:hypothetical protein
MIAGIVERGPQWSALDAAQAPGIAGLVETSVSVVSPTVSPAVDKAARPLPNWFALGADA